MIAPYQAPDIQDKALLSHHFQCTAQNNQDQYQHLTQEQKERVQKAEQALAFSNAASIAFDRCNEIYRALVDQSELCITDLGQSADKFYSFISQIFKRCVNGIWKKYPNAVYEAYQTKSTSCEEDYSVQAYADQHGRWHHHTFPKIKEEVRQIEQELVTNQAAVSLKSDQIEEEVYKFANKFLKRSTKEILQAEPQTNPKPDEAPTQPPEEQPIPTIPPETGPTTQANNGYFCSSRLFRYDLGTGGISMQIKVLNEDIDCTCASNNAYNQAKFKLIYISDLKPTNQREYTFTSHNITAVFTADQYLPKQLIDLIPEKMPSVLEYVANECITEKYNTTKIILGVTISIGGALILGSIALYYNRQHLKGCQSKCCV